MWFRILNIDRITNSIEVECHSFDGLNVFPEVWSLDSTEAGFEIGDYKIMCWTGDDTAVRKIAERDFYVYKIGKIIWNNIFISDIRGHYYAPIRPNKIVPLIAYSPCIGVYRIDRGYHSYKWVALDDTYPNFRCLCLGSYDPDLRESLEGYKFCCIATFIVPKGAEYFENKYGHIVSSEIIYTGKYLRISNFNK